MQNKTPIRFSKREAPPLVGKDGRQNVLMCPFCEPSHPLQMGQGTNACGSEVEVRVTQPIIKAHRYPGLVCVKCRKGGGKMVPFQQGFIHDYNCMPNRVTMTETPVPSRLAKWVHDLKPGRVKAFFTKRYGVAAPIQEVLPDGKLTGVITGYFFYKGPPNGKRSDERERIQTPAGE